MHSIIINVNLPARDGNKSSMDHAQTGNLDRSILNSSGRGLRNLCNVLRNNVEEAEKVQRLTRAENANSYESFLPNNIEPSAERVTHHNPSTFFLQTMYFIIKFLENLAVVLYVIWKYRMRENTNFHLHGIAWKTGLALGVGSIISWLSHTAYYRIYGHPWKYANGPTMSSKSFKCVMYVCGEVKRIDMPKTQRK